MTGGFFHRPDLSARPAARSLRADTVITGASLALQGGLRLLFLVLAARYLGPAHYSDLGTALAIGTLAAILGPASLGAAFSKYVGRRSFTARELQESGGAARHLLSRFHVVAPVTSVAAGVVMALLINWSMALPTAVLSLGLAAQALGRGVHMSLGMSHREGALQILAGTIAVIGLVTADANGWASARTACLILGGALLAYLGGSYPVTGSQQPPERQLRRDIDGFIAIAVLGSVASAGLVQLCIAVGQIRLLPGEAGQLAAAASLATPLALAASAVGLVAYPRMARLALSIGDGRLKALRGQLSLVLAMFGASAVLVVALVGENLAAWMLGDSFAESATALVPLVVGVVFTSIASASASALSATQNRALATVSGSAWGGLVVAVVLWATVPATGGWVARAYAIACWISATAIIFAADRLLRANLATRWLVLSLGIWLISADPATESFVPLLLGSALAVAALSTPLSRAKSRDSKP